MGEELLATRQWILFLPAQESSSSLHEFIVQSSL